MGDEFFLHHGEVSPASPVVLSVPHAGRAYPPALCAALKVPLSAIEALEDRFVDLVADAARGRRSMLVQTCPRAWIDLNRSEDERDPRVDEGGASMLCGPPSAKLRSGLGLVPRRATGPGDIWRHRFRAADIDERIARAHRPYHAALAALLAAARAKFGVAVLLDIHSMPPLVNGPGAARLVIGDRFGRAAGARLVARIEATARAAGTRTALNTPYAGGHLLERHGDPASGIHAVQLEFDRSLYLDARFSQPAHGLHATAALLRSIADAVEDDVLGLAAPFAQAAE